MATILVVDDSAVVRRFVVRTLSDRDYQVLEAKNGDEALRTAAARPLDLVITDMLMPERDGIEVIRQIRERTPRTKIIAMSGSTHTSVYLRLARSFGADVVLAKPFQPAELLETVARLLAA